MHGRAERVGVCVYDALPFATLLPHLFQVEVLVDSLCEQLFEPDDVFQTLTAAIAFGRKGAPYGALDRRRGP